MPANSLRRFALAAALGLMGASAQAALLAPSGGAEAIISFANTNGDTISFDSGDTSVGAGDIYTLPSAVVSFINAAGGAASVTFGIISGNTTARNYLTSSANEFFAAGADGGGVDIANSVRNLWSGQLTQFVQDLNASAPSSPTTQNDTYGPFLTGTGSPNYIDGGFDNWGSGDFAFSSLGSGAASLFLYTVQFGTGNLGFATVGALSGGLVATLDLTQNRVVIGDAAPIPAPPAVWLLGTAVLPLARRMFRKRAAA